MLHTLHSSIEVVGLSRQRSEISLYFHGIGREKKCFDHFDPLSTKISVPGGTEVIAASNTAFLFKL